MKIKLNWLQARKYQSIRKYLKTDTGKEKGLLLSINNSTNVYSLYMLYTTGSGIYIKGRSYPRGMYSTDRLYDGTEITDIYKAGLKADSDFRNFIDHEKKEFKK